MNRSCRAVLFSLTILLWPCSTPSIAQQFWSQTNGPCAEWVLCRAVAQDGSILTGTQDGIRCRVRDGWDRVYAHADSRKAFRSTDDGYYWTPIDSGSGITNIQILGTDKEGYLCAGTRGESVFRSISPVTDSTMAAPQLLSPADSANRVPNPVTMRWSAVPGADSYQVQLFWLYSPTPSVDTSGISALEFTSLIDADLILLVRWRVRAVNSSGVGPWSATFMFQPAYPLPEAPRLLSPANNAVNLPRTITMSWMQIGWEDSSCVQISRSPSFFPIDSQWVIPRWATHCTVGPLMPKTTYYWRVSAKNASGTSAWSEVRNFSTAADTVGAPMLVSPHDTATLVSTQPVCLWHRLPGATGYSLQIGTKPDATPAILFFSGISDTTATATGLAAGTKYYWKVRGTDGAVEGPWSAPWSFTTLDTQLVKPQLVSPGNGEMEIALDTLLIWTPVAGAAEYHLQATSGPATILDTTLAATSCAIQNLVTGMTYTWRVQAQNSNASSPWSDTWQFTTRYPIPQAPMLRTPTNNATDIALDTSLTWFPSLGATSYNIQLTSDRLFGTIETDSGNISTTGYSVLGLKENTTYYWRVSSSNNSGTSAWSSIWNFTTRNATTVERNPIRAASILLDGNYPNPFSEHTTIRYMLPAAELVRVEICDVFGRTTIMLVNEHQDAGWHQVTVDPTASRSPLRSGINFCRVTAGTQVITRSMILLR